MVIIILLLTITLLSLKINLIKNYPRVSFIHTYNHVALQNYEIFLVDMNYDIKF